MLTIGSDKYRQNGILIYSGSDRVKVVYNGLLAKSGADSVYAHTGFGSNWDNIYDYKMLKTSAGFEATIPIHTRSSLNIAFKDCANNWDNNTGNNYIFDVIQ